MYGNCGLKPSLSGQGGSGHPSCTDCTTVFEIIDPFTTGQALFTVGEELKVVPSFVQIFQ